MPSRRSAQRQALDALHLNQGLSDMMSGYIFNPQIHSNLAAQLGSTGLENQFQLGLQDRPCRVAES